MTVTDDGNVSWSFTAKPSVTNGTVSFTFQGPATADTIQVNVSGLRNGVITDGYNAGTQAFSAYNGSATTVSIPLSSSNDALYKVEIYDTTTGARLRWYLPVYGDWQVATGAVTRTGGVKKANAYSDSGNERIYDYAFMAIRRKAIKVGTLGRTWSQWEPGSFGGMNGLFSTRTGAVSFKEAVPIELEPEVLHAFLTRRWGGIGGFIYVPSFPQLDRKRTVFPSAR